MHLAIGAYNPIVYKPLVTYYANINEPLMLASIVSVVYYKRVHGYTYMYQFMVIIAIMSIILGIYVVIYFCIRFSNTHAVYRCVKR